MPKTYSESALHMEQRARAAAVQAASAIVTGAERPDRSMFEALRSTIDRYEASFDTTVWSNYDGMEYVIKDEAPAGEITD